MKVRDKRKEGKKGEGSRRTKRNVKDRRTKGEREGMWGGRRARRKGGKMGRSMR